MGDVGNCGTRISAGGMGHRDLVVVSGADDSCGDCRMVVVTSSTAMVTLMSFARIGDCCCQRLDCLLSMALSLPSSC